jgi:hypothetical protein
VLRSHWTADDRGDLRVDRVALAEQPGDGAKFVSMHNSSLQYRTDRECGEAGPSRLSRPDPHAKIDASGYVPSFRGRGVGRG